MELTPDYIRSLSGLSPELREILSAMAEKLAKLEAPAVSS